MKSYKDRLLLALDNTYLNAESINTAGVQLLTDCVLECKQKGRKMFLIGNGGSAGIAMHMTADFLKNGGVKTYDMFAPATITCLGNDFGYEYIFSKQLDMWAESDDLLVAISSSGNSANIVNAINSARKHKCKIITMSGFKQDNKINAMGDYNVYVPCMEYGIVESIHNMILQQIVDDIVQAYGVGMQ